MNICDLVNKQKKFYITNKTKDVNYRINALKKLKEVIIKNEKNIYDALNKDLNKSNFESYMCEIGIVLNEITYTLKNIKKWSKIKKVPTPISQFYSKSFIVPESYGIVLIISPWNYPFLLSMQPLISAIAAGNCAIIKPSEYSPNISKLLHDIISEVFDFKYVAVIEGDLKVSQELLNEDLDYIFYTGSNKVGKIIMEKASKNLIPVTLELGGKSPCIIDETANIELASKRIIFGKILNAGQTCVAPDYVLINNKIKKQFIECLKHNIYEFLGKSPLENKDYPKIINQNNFNRLIDLIKNENIIFGGEFDRDSLKFSPTLIDNVKLDSNIMKEEIFGPVLPIISYNNIHEAINVIKNNDKPLALYIFTNDKRVEDKIINEVSFGGGCINDTVVHLASTYLGFGGIGKSGMGAYHGKYGFDTFTHYKSILKKSNLIDLQMRYHKYTNKKLNLIKKFIK